MLRNLFKKRDLSELLAEADSLFQEARYGDAKLAYDRVAERAAKEKPELIQRAEERAFECCDRMALARAEEAVRLHAAGEHELARHELRNALEIARSEVAQARVREHMSELDNQQEAVETASEAAPLSDEERLMLIAGAWEPLQAEELERYGERLLEATLAIERSDGAAALPLLDALLAENEDASYLWLELGRARLLCRALDEAERALRTFLKRIGPEEGGAARLLAHRELARVAHERGDRAAAVAVLEAAAEALPDDPRPLLDLGNYLRLIERPREAIEVLELCAGLFTDGEVEWPVSLELGLSCAAAGERARAIELLEEVVQSLLAKGHLDLPPPAAATLAELHEADGNLIRAADLFRILAQGSDHEGRARYHGEAARLLDVLGLTDEAAKMKARLPATALRSHAEARAPLGASQPSPRSSDDPVDTGKAQV